MVVMPPRPLKAAAAATTTCRRPRRRRASAIRPHDVRRAVHDPLWHRLVGKLQVVVADACLLVGCFGCFGVVVVVLGE
jgi:hypothetical protein